MELVEREVGKQAPWRLGYLEVAAEEGRKLLNDEQYDHAVDQFEALATEVDPTRSLTADVQAIDRFYELRDKGGILGKINLRVYFTVETARKIIVVLGVYKKEDEKQAPKWLIVKMRNRLRIVREQLR